MAAGGNGFCGNACGAAAGYDFVTGLGSPPRSVTAEPQYILLLASVPGTDTEVCDRVHGCLQVVTVHEGRQNNGPDPHSPPQRCDRQTTVALARVRWPAAAPYATLYAMGFQHTSESGSA
jgi:hypothetical protein